MALSLMTFCSVHPPCIPQSLTPFAPRSAKLYCVVGEINRIAGFRLAKLKHETGEIASESESVAEFGEAHFKSMIGSKSCQ
jgi:hypothetical protein